MRRRAFLIAVAAVLTVGGAGPALGQELRGSSFEIQHDHRGIRSLKRIADIHDTDYIAAYGRLGRLAIRYRRTPSGDWQELQEMLSTTSWAASVRRSRSAPAQSPSGASADSERSATTSSHYLAMSQAVAFRRRRVMR